MSTVAVHDYALYFLANHSREDAKELGVDLNFDSATRTPDTAKERIAQDPGAFITVSGTNITIEIPEKSLTFTGTFRSGTHISNITRGGATLFYRGSPPDKVQNQFWVQQYPPSVPGKDGRLVIELYTDNKIVAVAKTNVDNYGTSGLGTWS